MHIKFFSVTNNIWNRDVSNAFDEFVYATINLCRQDELSLTNLFINENTKEISSDYSETEETALIEWITKKYPDVPVFLYTELWERNYNPSGLDEFTFPRGKLYLFAVFYKNKVSHLIVDSIEYHHLMNIYIHSYIVYFQSDGCHGDLFPEYFSTFTDSNIFFLNIEKYKFSSSRFSSYKDFVFNLLRSRYTEVLSDEDVINEWILPNYNDIDQLKVSLGVPKDYFSLVWKRFDDLLDESSDTSTRNYIMFFDTETNGLINDLGEDIRNWENFPQIVQLSWVIYDERQRLVMVQDFIIKPVDFLIKAESTKIHGIDQETANLLGENLEVVLKVFQRDVYYCNNLVGHNLDFDIKVINASVNKLLWTGRFVNISQLFIDWPEGEEDFFMTDITGFRFRRNDDYEKISCFCTMVDLTSYWETKGITRWLKLTELYNKLFSTEYQGVHNSLNDVKATADCYFILKEMSLIDNNKSIGRINCI